MICLLFLSLTLRCEEHGLAPAFWCVFAMWVSTSCVYAQVLFALASVFLWVDYLSWLKDWFVRFWCWALALLHLAIAVTMLGAFHLEQKPGQMHSPYSPPPLSPPMFSAMLLATLYFV